MQPLEEPKSQSQTEQALVRGQDEQRRGQCVDRAEKAGVASKRSGKAERRVSRKLHCGMLLGWGVANLPPLTFSSQHLPPQHLPQGLAFSNGPRWPMLRNFALGALKEFGLGMRTIEERVLEEAACLLGEISSP